MSDAAAQSDAAKQAGNAALGKGDVEGAIAHFTRAIELVPTNQVLFSNRSVAYARQGEYEKALKDAEEAVRLKPDWSKAYGRQGTALFHLSRFEASIAAYDKGLAIDADNTVLKDGREAAHKKLLASEANVHAEERINRAKYAQAVSFLDQAVELDPGNALYHVNRSLVQRHVGQHEDAVKEADLAIHLRPDWHRGFQRKAEALSAQRQFDSACALYAHALSLNPGNEAMTAAFNKCQSDAFLAAKKKELEKKAKKDAVKAAKKAKSGKATLFEELAPKPARRGAKQPRKW